MEEFLRAFAYDPRVHVYFDIQNPFHNLEHSSLDIGGKVTNRLGKPSRCRALRS